MGFQKAYNAKLDYLWTKLPFFATQVIATIAIFLFGISINGDWIHIYVHLVKQLGYGSKAANISDHLTFATLTLESLHLKNVFNYWVSSVSISFAIYFAIGGFIQWYFYIRQKDRSEEWKCQPNKWLTPELERHEILFGSLTLFVTSSMSAILSCYIANGGYSLVYYDPSEYGWLWFLLQGPAVFIAQDYAIYWIHRIYHVPFLYKNFHKLHHKYKHPTAFSVTAIHPVEAVHIQLTSVLPLFLVPLHWAPFYVVALYTYYHGIITHSGVDLKSYWWQPWQPDPIFHDNHHQYFHVNFAFNISIWDKLHGTYRRRDRIYREDIFYGRGKSISEAGKAELQEELEERAAENPNAHRDKSALLIDKKTE